MADKEILVADDDSNVRLMFRLILEGAGYAVREAPNGIGALILIRDALPDLVLTDMVMPVMDGEELISRLRSDPRTAALPILAVSGHANTRGKAQLADGILAKPIDRKVLIEAVASLLEERERSGPG
jgi:CheY-like chemotaxis protein